MTDTQVDTLNGILNNTQATNFFQRTNVTQPGQLPFDPDAFADQIDDYVGNAIRIAYLPDFYISVVSGLMLILLGGFCLLAQFPKGKVHSL